MHGSVSCLVVCVNVATLPWHSIWWANPYILPPLFLRQWTLTTEPRDQWLGLDDVLPSDSRFREDLLALKVGDLKQAQAQKEKLEKRQRQDKKLRESLKADWSSTCLSLVTVSYITSMLMVGCSRSGKFSWPRFFLSVCPMLVCGEKVSCTWYLIEGNPSTY